MRGAQKRGPGSAVATATAVNRPPLGWTSAGATAAVACEALGSVALGCGGHANLKHKGFLAQKRRHS